MATREEEEERVEEERKTEDERRQKEAAGCELSCDFTERSHVGFIKTADRSACACLSVSSNLQVQTPDNNVSHSNQCRKGT